MTTAIALLTRERLLELFSAVEAGLERPGRLFLTGESSLVVAGAQEWTARLTFAAAEGEAGPVLERLAAGAGIEVEREHPGDVVPLPRGHEGRARRVAGWRKAPPAAERLEVLHFDPVSVALRLVARGDERDYLAVLGYLRHGFVSMDELERGRVEVLPSFSAERLQQDPAEFRRKWKGLQQMWRALPPPPARVP